MNNKPITIIREEFIQALVELCNNSGLPFFVIEDVLKGMLQEVHSANLKQLEEDKKRYEAQNKKIEQ
jgi:hypothetical protein